MMNSPFSNVLNTNYVPSDDETSTIRGIVASRKAVLEGLEDQIRALTAERDKEEKFIEEHNALVSPTRRLPTDILSSIFLCYMEQCRWCSSYRGAQHPAILLTHICQRWRQVALSTPLLWNVIRFRFPMYPYRVSSHSRRSGTQEVWKRIGEAWQARILKQESNLAMCLERSVNCPLRLTVVASDPFPLTPGSGDQWMGLDEDARHRAIAAICETAPRWEQLTLDTNMYSFDSPLLQLFGIAAENAPLLQSVETTYTLPHRDTPQIESCFRNFKLFGAPTLRTMRWGTPLPATMISVLPVHWKGLTELYVGEQRMGSSGRMSFTDAIPLLEMCPNLVRCTLSLRQEGHSAGPAQQSVPFTFQRQVCLPQLQTLGLRSTVIPLDFASAIAAPSLHTLLIVARRCKYSTNENGLVQFVEAFGDQLRHVTFNYASLPQQGLLKCLQSLPLVSSLRLTADHANMGPISVFPDSFTPAVLDNASLATLTPAYDEQGHVVGQCLCPKLEQFCCHLVGQEFNEEALVKFVTARRTIPEASQHEIARVRDVEVRFDYSEALDVRRALQEADVDMGNCNLRVRYLGLERQVEKQLGYGDYREAEMYGDGFSNEFEDLASFM